MPDDALSTAVREYIASYLSEPRRPYILPSREGETWAFIEQVAWPNPSPELDGLREHVATGSALLRGRSLEHCVALWDTYRALGRALGLARKRWAREGTPVTVPEGAYEHNLDEYAVLSGETTYRSAFASPAAASRLAAGAGFRAYSTALVSFTDIFTEVVTQATNREQELLIARLAQRSVVRDELQKLGFVLDARETVQREAILEDVPTLPEAEFWALVDRLDWKRDCNSHRAGLALGSMLGAAEQLAFAERRRSCLAHLGQAVLAWEAETSTPVEAAGDRLHDLLNHVIGLGRSVYERTLADPRLGAERAGRGDYEESFAYVERVAWAQLPRDRALKRRIEELGGRAALPVVSLELFFDGNVAPGSIGCNLSPRPSSSVFYRVLADMRARPEVADIVVQIVDGMGPDDWPFSDRIYVITTATDEEVHAWAAALHPDPPSPDRYTGWFGEIAPPPGAPVVPPGYRVTYLFWD